MQRAIRLKLTPSPAQAVSLEETSRLFTEAFNLFVCLGWNAKVGNATKLHYLAYYPVRESLPTLNSNLINTAQGDEKRHAAFTEGAREAGPLSP